MGRQYQVVWHSCTNVNLLELPLTLLHFLTDTFGSHVRLATEYVRDVYTFRCHPAYQSGRPIYDWLNVQFDNGIVGPCRLAAVVVLDDNPHNPERFRLVVQAAIQRSRKDSVLFTEWSWLPTYRSISPNTIHAPCFVISIKDDDSKILVAKPYDEWPAQFTHLHL
jgi:hypothetical protein